MKQIIAYIRPAVFERVTEALRSIDGLTGMSVMEVKGFGQGKDFLSRDQKEAEISYFNTIVRIEIMVSDVIVRKTVDTIQQQAWTGGRSEGKIYVLNVEEAVRIRTNERGEAAV